MKALKPTLSSIILLVLLLVSAMMNHQQKTEQSLEIGLVLR